MKKFLGGLAIAATIIGGASGVYAQTTRSNMYNDAGSKFNIVTKNFATSYTLTKDFTLKFGTTSIGTWLQKSEGTGETPFFLALGNVPAGALDSALREGRKNIPGLNSDVILYSGTYNVETGACTATRISNDANNGTVGKCAFAPVGKPVAWIKCGGESDTCQMGGAPMEVRYGANGTYVTKTVSQAFACTNAYFGSDPVPNVVKSCELR